MTRRLVVEAFGNTPREIEYDAVLKARKFFGQDIPLFVGDYEVQFFAGSMTNKAAFRAVIRVSDHDPNEDAR